MGFYLECLVALQVAPLVLTARRHNLAALWQKCRLTKSKPEHQQTYACLNFPTRECYTSITRRRLSNFVNEQDGEGMLRISNTSSLVKLCQWTWLHSRNRHMMYYYYTTDEGTDLRILWQVGSGTRGKCISHLRKFTLAVFQLRFFSG